MIFHFSNNGKSIRMPLLVLPLLFSLMLAELPLLVSSAAEDEIAIESTSENVRTHKKSKDEWRKPTSKKKTDDEDGYYGSLKKKVDEDTATGNQATSNSNSSVPAQPTPESSQQQPPASTSPPGDKQQVPSAEVSSAPTASVISRSEPKLFLWKGGRDKQSVYILGTIHVAQKSFYPLPPEIDKALHESQVLYVEALSPTAKQSQAVQELNKKRGLYPAGDKLSKHLSSDTTQLFNSYLDWAGESLSMYEEHRPWLVEELVSAAALRRHGFKPENGIDLYLVHEAEKSNKKIDGLETPESHIELLANVPDDVQDRSLGLTVRRLPEMPRFVEQATRAWRNGDPVAMERILREDADLSADSKAAYEKIVTARNKSMAATLDRVLKDGTTFVAVGSAHVVGETGIVKLLEQKGFKFEQVTPAPRFPVQTQSAQRSSGKLRRMSFPEGRFSISMPGTPEMEYQDAEIGRGLRLRVVLYGYPEYFGKYLAGYVIVPQQLDMNNPALKENLLNSMVNSIATGGGKAATAPAGKTAKSKAAPTKPVIVSQSAMNFQGHPGREVLTKAKDATGSETYARIRFFVVGHYLYIIGGEGKKVWLDSPACMDYVNSFLIASQASPSSKHTSWDRSHKEFSSNMDMMHRKHSEEFSRHRADFTRDRNAQKSRWEREHGHF